MGTRCGRAVVAIGVLLLATGCGGPPIGSGSPSAGQSAEPPGDPAGPIPAVDPAAIRYTCGRFPFGQEVLAVVRNDERAATPFAAALRIHVARQEMDINWVRDIDQQCRNAGVAHFFKQRYEAGRIVDDGLLDGVVRQSWPVNG